MEALTGEPRIGVMGCLPSMPDAFPLDMRENSGNMIHGRAPFELFPDTLFYTDRRFGTGRRNFLEYLNSECTHIVITLANTLRIGRPDGLAYSRLQRFLERCHVPIVIFGLGAQAKQQEFPADGLPPEAIDLLKYLGDHTELIGVRGEYTAAVIEHYAGVKNTFVTGCPSFFSRPFAFDELAASLSANRSGRAAFNMTKPADPDEQRLIRRAVTSDLHWIEAANARITAYAYKLQRGVPRPWVPPVLQELLTDRVVSRPQLEDYFSRRFQLFRDTASWYKFNADCVGFTFGTRFHGNMASLLSGVPALWVTHDSRTEEFTDYLKLPAIRKEQAAELGVDDLRLLVDYGPMYEALPHLFGRFNQYLTAHGLPAVPLPKAASEPPAVATLRKLPPRPSLAGQVVRRVRRKARSLSRRVANAGRDDAVAQLQESVDTQV